MSKFISKSELEALAIQKPQPNVKSYNIGEIYPTIFESDKGYDFKPELPLDVAIIWLGSYRIEDTSDFTRIKCPICGKEEALIPYMCGASVLSGAHTIRFYCTNCSELFVTNDDSDYYHKIRDYVIQNKRDLSPSPRFKSCTTIDSPKSITLK